MNPSIIILQSDIHIVGKRALLRRYTHIYTVYNSTPLVFLVGDEIPMVKAAVLMVAFILFSVWGMEELRPLF